MFGQTKQEEAEIDRVLSLMDQPVDVATANRLLVEINQVMNENNVVFFLRQGTCLGLVRDGELIPWDDDIDIGSIYGYHGFSEETITSTIPKFREKGFLVRVTRNDYYKDVTLIKGSMRIDWGCYWVIDDVIVMYPAIPIPVNLFVNLEEVTYMGYKYLIPNPPEEYLRSKYGDDWRIPKRTGEYEGDVINVISNKHHSGWSRNFSHLMERLFWWFCTKVNIIDEQGEPLSGVKVFIPGLGMYRTTKKGVFRVLLPGLDYYALKININNSERILYLEQLQPRANYIYQLGTEHLIPADKPDQVLDSR